MFVIRCDVVALLKIRWLSAIKNTFTCSVFRYTNAWKWSYSQNQASLKWREMCLISKPNCVGRVWEGLPASSLLFVFIWNISCCRVWNCVAFFLTSEMAFSIVSILDRKLSKSALPFVFFSDESFACRRKTKLSNISMRSCSYRYTIAWAKCYLCITLDWEFSRVYRESSK